MTQADWEVEMIYFGAMDSGLVEISRPLQGDEGELIAEALEAGRESGQIGVVCDEPVLRWAVR